MKKPYTAFTIVLILGFIISISVTVSKLNSINNDLTNRISQENSSLRNEIATIRSEISTIEYRISEELTKQASIIESYDIKYGKLNADTLKVPVEIQVTPKEYTESTLITAYIGNKVIDAKRTGSTFIANVDATLFTGYSIKISIETDGIIKTEELNERIDTVYMISEKAKADINGRTAYEKNKKFFFENNAISVWYSPFENSTITNVRLFATIDGNEIWEKDITELFPSGETYASFLFSKSFDIKENQELSLFVEVTESNGLKYRMFIEGIIIKEDGFVNIGTNRPYILIDKNGNEINVGYN